MDDKDSNKKHETTVDLETSWHPHVANSYMIAIIQVYFTLVFRFFLYHHHFVKGHPAPSSPPWNPWGDCQPPQKNWWFVTCMDTKSATMSITPRQKHHVCITYIQVPWCHFLHLVQNHRLFSMLLLMLQSLVYKHWYTETSPSIWYVWCRVFWFSFINKIGRPSVARICLDGSDKKTIGNWRWLQMNIEIISCVHNPGNPYPQDKANWSLLGMPVLKLALTPPTLLRPPSLFEAVPTLIRTQHLQLLH